MMKVKMLQACRRPPYDDPSISNNLCSLTKILLFPITVPNLDAFPGNVGCYLQRRKSNYLSPTFQFVERMQENNWILGDWAFRNPSAALAIYKDGERHPFVANTTPLNLEDLVFAAWNEAARSRMGWPPPWRAPCWPAQSALGQRTRFLLLFRSFLRGWLRTNTFPEKQ